MRMSYYPGCSLSGTSAEYDRSIQEVAGLLDIELVELMDWNCCGASSGHMTDHRIAIELSHRNLSKAAEVGLDLLVPCSACFQRLRVADQAQKTESSKFSIFHLTRLLSQPIMLKKLKSLVKRPLAKLNLACYYGCLSLRPPNVTGARDYEDPRGLDLIASALGAISVRWSHKTECCSSSLSMSRPDIAKHLVGEIVTAARRAGSHALVTDCPMCQANIESRQADQGSAMPVFFITELMAYALTKEERSDLWRQHLIDPAGMLNGM